MQRQRPGASTVSTPFNCSSLEAFLVLLLLVSLLLTLLGAILSAVLPLRISLDRRHILLTHWSCAQLPVLPPSQGAEVARGTPLEAAAIREAKWQL